ARGPGSRLRRDERRRHVRFNWKLSAAAIRRHASYYVAIGAAIIAAVAASMLSVPGLAGVLGAALAGTMIAIAVIDARRFIIPDKLVLTALAVGIVDAWIVQSEASASAALLAAALRGLGLALAFWILRAVYLRLRGQEGIGLGDVKLAA